MALRLAGCLADNVDFGAGKHGSQCILNRTGYGSSCAALCQGETAETGNEHAYSRRMSDAEHVCHLAQFCVRPPVYAQLQIVGDQIFGWARSFLEGFQRRYDQPIESHPPDNDMMFRGLTVLALRVQFID